MAILQTNWVIEEHPIEISKNLFYRDYKGYCKEELCKVEKWWGQKHKSSVKNKVTDELIYRGASDRNFEKLVK